MDSIHVRIRLARRQAGVSQSEFAKRIGVQRSAVAQWESAGGVKPTMENLIKVAMLGSMQVEWLASGRGKMALPNQGLADDQITSLQLAEFALSDDEQRLLRAVRNLDRKTLSAIVVLTESLSIARRSKPKQYFSQQEFGGRAEFEIRRPERGSSPGSSTSCGDGR